MMQDLLARRIQLTPRPQNDTVLPLEVAMLGHCPGRVRPERLLALGDALNTIRQAGYGERLSQIEINPDSASLYHLPLPLHSASEFHDIFPDAGRKRTIYRSSLAGNLAWLAPCVDDFFANGGHRLWVVVIPEEEAQQGFFASEHTDLTDPSTLTGIATLMTVPAIGAVCLPDLERLQIPARLPDIPRVRLDNPEPTFLPCTQSLDDDHRERRSEREMALDDLPEPLHFQKLLREILHWLTRYRPDMQCLLTLPLAYANEVDSPDADPAALELLSSMQLSESAHYLRQIQFVYPYVRGQGRALLSPVGLLAGKQAATAKVSGPWRSIAGQPLISKNLPYPRMKRDEVVRLREEPGISILELRNNRVELDDERLCVPALPADDYRHASSLERFDGYRTAELMRLMGYLRRQLRQFGEQLVFNSDVNDPRPRLLIEHFLKQLWQRGALRGERSEHAFSLRQIPAGESTLLLEIEIAPALPIDRIRLTFTNSGADWQTEVQSV
ncbi:MAG: hypothetical protein VXZ24_03600 [Pseudomonadota bacterium]|nr:hypothetical protein [Pseudomonadota bacterium]